MAGYCPEYCVWETTLACNLQCRHCGSAAGCARPQELTTAEGLELLAQLAALGTREVTFSGGEFVLRPDWRQLLSRARELGLSALVVSNGLALSPAVVADFAARGVACVSVSVDGAAAVHNRLRPLNSGTAGAQGLADPAAAHDSFTQAMAAFANLAAGGVPAAAITQVSRANLHELPAVREILLARGVRRWQIQLSNPMGRMRDRVDGSVGKPSGRGSAPTTPAGAEPAPAPGAVFCDTDRKAGRCRTTVGGVPRPPVRCQTYRGGLAGSAETWPVRGPDGVSPAGIVEPVLPGDVVCVSAFIRETQRGGGIRCQAADNIGYFGRDEAELRSAGGGHTAFWTGCQAGLRAIGITSDGGVRGCLSMPPELQEGNVRETPLRLIWERPDAFAYNRSFDRSSLTGACRDCEFGKLCRAGCHSFTTAALGCLTENTHCLRLVPPQP